MGNINTTTRSSSPLDQLLVNAVDAARLLSVSERTFHSLRHSEAFPKPIMLGSGRCTRWKTRELADYVASLPPGEAQLEPGQLRSNREGRQR